MSLKLTNINGDLYIIDSDNPNFKCAVVNMIKINEGAFLVGQSENKINNFDVTTIENFSNGLNFNVRKSTKAENLLMGYIQKTLQQKIGEGQLKTITDLRIAVSDINTYMNSQSILLKDLKELEGKDNIAAAQQEALEDYFVEKMSNNKYFKKEIIKDVQENTQLNQPVTIPYDEQAVTEILKRQSTTPTANFDVDKFFNKFYEQFTTKQIDLLLNNFKLDENKVTMLKQRKDTIKVFNSLEKAENKQNEINTNEANTTSNVVEKRKRFTLFGDKDDNKKAAFVDTLLLSFTIGTLCGVYLMYFILTIMS